MSEQDKVTEATDSKNPANLRELGRASRTRIPMSVPHQKLAVPDIPGYHMHWMRGAPDRIQQALAAGYQFVEKDEVMLNSFGLADSADSDGGTDLGTRVSIVAGGEVDGSGQAVRMYLMKLPREWWEDDQVALGKRSDQLAAALKGGKIPGQANPHGQENTYVKQADLFTRKN